MNEARLKRVEDQLAIRDLRYRYCHYVDQEQWQLAADMFTEDGEFVGIETASGREAVKGWFSRSVPGAMKKAWHLVHNDFVDIEGDKAHGFVAFDFYFIDLEGNAMHGVGRYEDEIVRTDQGWKFKKRTVHFDFIVPWKQGFGAAAD